MTMPTSCQVVVGLMLGRRWSTRPVQPTKSLMDTVAEAGNEKTDAVSGLVTQSPHGNFIERISTSEENYGVRALFT